jgi:hypothetical protein
LLPLLLPLVPSPLLLLLLLPLGSGLLSECL